MEKETKMNLEINRNAWIHGEGSDPSWLLRSYDQKQCCIGIYLSACGIEKKHLEQLKIANHVMTTVPTWLLTGPSPASLYEVNDDVDISESKRESKIKAIFAKHGVEVTFTRK